MESLGRLESICHSGSEEALDVSKKRDVVNVLKVISLIFNGLTGYAAFGFFGAFWSLIDPDYQALLSQMAVIGYICTGFAVLTIMLSLIFKKNEFVFITLSFSTAIFGSFQFVVFAISPFRHGLRGHFQYSITLVLSLIILILTYVYIAESRKKK